MLCDVPNFLNLRDAFPDGFLDALLHGGTRHAASLAAARHFKENDAVLEVDQYGSAAMRGQRRIDLLIENLLDLRGNAAFGRVQLSQGSFHFKFAAYQLKHKVNGRAFQIGCTVRSDIEIDAIEGLNGI